MSSKTTLAAICFAIFIVAATTPSASAASSDDACALLSQAQVSAALGSSMGAGTYVTPGYVKTCTWNPAGVPIKGVSSVTLSMQAADAFAAAKNLMEQAKTRMKEEKPESAGQLENASVSGIGDDAFYTSMGGNYTGLLVKKGNVSFKVAIYGDLPTEKKKAAEKALALQVLSKF